MICPGVDEALIGDDFFEERLFGAEFGLFSVGERSMLQSEFQVVLVRFFEKGEVVASKIMVFEALDMAEIFRELEIF